MKLVELAEKISIDRSAIVAFLKTNGNLVEEGVDVELSLEEVARVRRYFARMRGDRSVAASQQELKEAPAPVHSPSTTKEDSQTSEPTEMLRVETERVELPGLKVLGKIELPLPAEKIRSTVEPSDKRAGPLGSRSKRRAPAVELRKEILRKTRVSPVSLAEQREQQLEERSKRHRKKDQERKTRRYKDRMSQQYSGPVQPLRKDLSSEYEVLGEEEYEPPKRRSLLRRIIGWFIRA